MSIYAAYRRGVRWSLAGSLGAGFFQFLQMVAFARLAGPSAAGDYALAATIIGFLMPLAEAGLSQALVQAKEVRPAQVATLLWVNVALGVLIFILLWIFGPFVAGWYGRPELPGLMLLMGAALLFTPFGAQLSGLLQRDMHFDRLTKVETLSWLFSFLLVTVLAGLGWGAWAMAAGFLFRNVLVSVGCLWVSRRIFPVPWLNPEPLYRIRPLLRFGAFDLGARWADFLTNYLDKLIVGKWLGIPALGYYNLAFTFLMLPTARLGYVLTRASYPVFAKIRDDAAQLQMFFTQLTGQLILVLFPVYAGMALFAREIVLLCFGENWLPAAPLFVAFGMAGLVRSLSAAFPQLLNGLGKPHWALQYNLLWACALNATLIVFLWIYPSAISAAWSRTAAKYLFEIALLWGLANLCGLAFSPVLRFAGRTIFYLLPVAVLTGLVGWIPGNIWVVFAVKATVFICGMAWFVFKSPMKNSIAMVIDNFRKANKYEQ